MNTKISDNQIANYQENGFLIYDAFLNKNEIMDLKKEIDNAIKEMGANKIAGREKSQRFEDKKGDNYNETVYLQRLNLWKINQYIKKFFTDNSLGEMLCKLAKVKKMRIWHDQTLQKQAWANPTAWHLDNPKWSFYSKNSISIWIALDDATIQNGCLFYLPKSHKLAKYENDVRIGEKMDDLFELYPEFRHIDPVAAEMKAGDAGFHNGLMAHAAGANMTNNTRAAMTCAFMPDGSTYNGQQNVLSESYVAKLKIGDLLNDSSINPIVGDL